jgi:N-acyl amino acid synthase of PEP-CTERM/exosortase system
MLSATMFAPAGEVARSTITESDSFEVFKSRLAVVPADSEELLDRVFRLRYQVYCVERGFEDRNDHPEGRERDVDDRRSLHFLVLDRATGEAAGTVRLILPQPGNALPVSKLSGACQPSLSLPWQSTAEVSRFAIAKAFRRALEASWCRSDGGRTALPIITFGLIQAIVMMSTIGGISHIVAMMEPALLRLLRRMGIEFHPVGGLVEHHGLRQPGWAPMAGLAERVKECHRELWEIATDAGRCLPTTPLLAVA